ncbi:MAG: conjugal transfer protein TraN, partial [Pseudomonadota bacterium]
VDPHRKVVDPTTIDLSSAQAIAGDPDAYLGPGVNPGGSTGTCNPLPHGAGGATTYLESCNEGSQVFTETRTCQAPLRVTVTGSLRYEHRCWQTLSIPGSDAAQGWCPDFRIEAAQAGAQCRFVRTEPSGMICLQGTVDDCSEPEYVDLWVYSCRAAVPGWNGVEVDTRRVASESVNESSCNAVTSGSDCTLETEICTEPDETRIINGLPVTRPCWEWQRSYQCHDLKPANDCAALAARPECSFSHDECLSYSGSTCTVHDRWYQCTAPGTGTPPPPAYVCADDLYCIDGECTSVAREASTEFKDAMVAMNVMGELRDDFDPNQLKIFSGEHLRCTKKIFGLSNCCSGKGVPLLTPWLCNSEDRDVDKKDDAGLCHYVGTYCSSKILGVCTTRKQSYCCYGSKLVRILNEQGKAQLGMQWGKAKDPDCEGFLIAQFQQLDLAQMDFGEVYAEFVDAAKLPDEIELSVQIQQRIETYYNLHGGV